MAGTLFSVAMGILAYGNLNKAEMKVSLFFIIILYSFYF